MKSYEELLSDIEEDMELMGSSHMVYAMEEDNLITDYDYLPSDSCTISITLRELQEKIHLQMLYAKTSAHIPEADKNAPKLAVIFPGIGYTSVLCRPSCQEARLSDPDRILRFPSRKCQR